MLNDYFYQAENGETIRVEAESYEQNSSSSSGQCPTRYLVKATLHYYYLPPFDNNPDYVVDVESPLTGPVGDPYPTEPNQPGRWLIEYANGVTTFHRVFNGYLKPLKYENLSKTRLDGLPDDCGSGGCTTEFYRGSQVIHSIDYCPSIDTEPPEDDCCDCWRQAAAIARTIRV